MRTGSGQTERRSQERDQCAPRFLKGHQGSESCLPVALGSGLGAAAPAWPVCVRARWPPSPRAGRLPRPWRTGGGAPLRAVSGTSPPKGLPLASITCFLGGVFSFLYRGRGRDGGAETPDAPSAPCPEVRGCAFQSSGEGVLPSLAGREENCPLFGGEGKLTMNEGFFLGGGGVSKSLLFS